MPKVSARSEPRPWCRRSRRPVRGETARGKRQREANCEDGETPAALLQSSRRSCRPPQLAHAYRMLVQPQMARSIAEELPHRNRNRRCDCGHPTAMRPNELGNRRPTARAKPRRWGVRVDRRVRALTALNAYTRQATKLTRNADPAEIANSVTKLSGYLSRSASNSVPPTIRVSPSPNRFVR